MTLQVMILDDHPAIREGLALQINRHSDMEVCGQAGTLSDAWQLLHDVDVDVAVVDIQLGDENGGEFVRRLRDSPASVRILVWSTFPDSIYALRMLDLGADGYIHKQHATREIVEAIREVAGGRIYVSDEVADQLLKREMGNSKRGSTVPSEVLSNRELDVFRLLGEGHTTGEISSQLHISEHTVDTHRQRIKHKLGVRTGRKLNHVALLWRMGKH